MVVSAASDLPSDPSTPAAPPVPIPPTESSEMADSLTSNWIKHLLHCGLMVLTLLGFCKLNGALRLTNWDPKLSELDPIQAYGFWGTVCLYGARLFAVLNVPQLAFNLIGLLFYNVFPGKVTLKGSPLLAPLINLRIVTRGDYPELVRNNVVRNVRTMIDAGLENYMVEVVTDKSIGLAEGRRIREVVVPKHYKTSTGALFKARALHYCLEDGINELSDNDWIVHLDEETLLTTNCVRGIVNFVLDGKHQFGQGLITYGNGKVVNWITTLADSVRVSDDMGKLRLQFRKFHRPLFSFKGSYVVSQVAAERAIGFDNGIDGSIAEDCYFAMLAASRGYSFDFIEGEMHEKSPFSMIDFIQQRKRWLQGLLLVVHSKEIPWATKWCLAFSVYATATLPLSLSNLIWAGLFPIPCPLVFDVLLGLAGGVGLYMYIFGVIKTFSLSRSGSWYKMPVGVIGVILVIPLIIILENVAVIWGLLGKKHKFHVVQKNIDEEEQKLTLDV